MPKAAHKVVVIGHRNPDTDSICSAIAYAELKNKTSSLVCEARRAGRMNQETEFVLRRFGVQPPRMCTDVNPKIRDVDYREMPGIPGSTSLRKAWEIMRDQKIDTLPVTSEDDELQGVITVKDIATANMDLFDTGILAKSRTSYRNILETLGATMVVGSEDAECTTGHIRIGTATPEMLESSMEKGDIVILTNRYESQLCAIEKEASLLIICNGAKVGRTIQRIAEETGVAIMTAPCDTYAAGKLMSQCAPISYYMTRDDIMKFTLVTPVADVTRVMAKVRHRYFPILDEDGKYCGMVSRRNIIALRKRRIILVDHNEATQAVEGFDQAEILEIIDHHRIGSLETSGPVYFRNQPVGCTATIITQMYDENGVEIRPQIAGLLAAIVLLAVSGFGVFRIGRGAQEIAGTFDADPGTFVQHDIAFILNTFSDPNGGSAQYGVVPIGGKLVAFRFPARWNASVKTISDATTSVLSGQSYSVDSFIRVTGTVKTMPEAVSSALYDWYTENNAYLQQIGAIGDSDDAADYLPDAIVCVDTVGSIPQGWVEGLTVAAVACLIYAIVVLIRILCGKYEQEKLPDITFELVDMAPETEAKPETAPEADSAPEAEPEAEAAQPEKSEETEDTPDA